MTPTIRIEDDVMSGLKKLAEPFTDTPNSVIRRLLQEKGVLPKLEEAVLQGQPVSDAEDRASWTSVRGITPQHVYEKFLLYVLANDFDGKGEKHEVTKAVLRLMRSHGFLGPADNVHVATGETRAENTIAWGRNALKERGLVAMPSRRGLWELTPKGVATGHAIKLPKANK